MTTRLSVNINNEAARALRKWAAFDDETVTGVVWRAISTYDLIKRSTLAGEEVALIKPDGSIEYLSFGDDE